MLKSVRFIQRIVIVSIMMVSCVGCELSDRDERLSNSIVPGNANHLMNYWSVGEYAEGLGVYLPEDAQHVFAVNVPSGGPYRVTYTVECPDESPSLNGIAGPSFYDYHLVFEAYNDAALCIGFPDGNMLVKAVLEQGSLEQVPLHTDGNIGLFAWPSEWNGWTKGDPHPTDTALRPATDAQVMVEHGVVAAGINTIDNPCRVSVPTPIPTPIPTPTSTPTSIPSSEYLITIEVLIDGEGGGIIAAPGVTVSSFDDIPMKKFTHPGGPITFTFIADEGGTIDWAEIEKPSGSGNFVEILSQAVSPATYSTTVNSDFTLRAYFVRANAYKVLVTRQSELSGHFQD